MRKNSALASGNPHEFPWQGTERHPSRYRWEVANDENARWWSSGRPADSQTLGGVPGASGAPMLSPEYPLKRMPALRRWKAGTDFVCAAVVRRGILEGLYSAPRDGQKARREEWDFLTS